MTYRSRNIHILLIAVLVTVLLLGVLAFAQPEPPSPDEEWYPPAPESTAPVRTVYTVSSVPGTGVPGAAGTVNMRIVDESGRVRSEVYGSERFCLQFVSPYDTFYIFLYEWYPPGSIPSGHWLISGAGPYSLWVGAIVNICYFAAEVGEPEGLHTWKLWLYNPNTRKWSVGIIRFNYYSFPRAVIERVEYPSDMLIGTSYELRVSVKNLGEIDYSYTVTVDGSGLSFTTAQQQSARVPAKSSVTLSFGFTPLVTSPRVRIELTGDGKVLDSKDLVLVARTLPPGPFTLGDVSPTTLKEGEEATLAFVVVNRGRGTAEGVTARIEAPGFQVISGLETIPNVPAGGSAKAVFRVRPLEGGVKNVKVTVTYTDSAGNSYSDVIESTVTVLARLVVSSSSVSGKPLEIPVTVNGVEQRVFDDWVNPEQKIRLSARSEIVGEGVRYVFVGWSDGVNLSTREVTLRKSASISAVYKVQYLVSAFTPYGSVEGAGWYDEGSTATVRLTATSVGFGIKSVFRYWEDKEGRVLSTSPSYSFVVDKPITLRAVWEADYTELLLAALATIVVFGIALYTLRGVRAGGRGRLPPPPPPV